MPYAKGVRGDRPNIYNVTMVNADTEYSQVLPMQCLNFMVHTRDESEFRLAFETGIVAVPGAPYLTVKAGSRYYEPEINNDYPLATRITLYFASDSDGKIIEIVTWR